MKRNSKKIMSEMNTSIVYLVMKQTDEKCTYL